MKKLGIIIAMAVTVVAYKDRRRGPLSPLEDFPPYQGVRRYPSFDEQHQPFREQSFKTQYQSYRQRPYRRDTFPERLSFKDHPLLKDYSPTKSRSFYADRSSFRDAPDSKGQASFFIDGGSFRDQQFREPITVFKNEQTLQGPISNDRYSYQQQSFGDDFRFTDTYDKQITSYKSQESGQELPLRDLEYLKHGNHGLGYVSLPPISPYENVLPFDGETSTTQAPSTTSPTTQKPLQQSTVSNVVSAITQLHTSATSQPKMALHTVTMPSVKSDTLANSAITSQSASTAPAIPTASVAAKQSSNVAHPPTVFPTMASLPAITTESPILSLGRHTFPRIDFPAKFTAPASYYVSSDSKNKLQQSLLGYLLSQQARNAIKNNEQSSLLNYALPDASYNGLNNKIPGSLSGYVLPVESKDSLRSSLLSYLLQPESSRGLSFQQSSLPETVNYVSLAGTFTDRAKLPMPSIPIATLSAVSRPLQTVNYVAALPRVPGFVTQDSSSALPLGMASTVSNFQRILDRQREGKKLVPPLPRDRIQEKLIFLTRFSVARGANGHVVPRARSLSTVLFFRLRGGYNFRNTTVSPISMDFFPSVRRPRSRFSVFLFIVANVRVLVSREVDKSNTDGGEEGCWFRQVRTTIIYTVYILYATTNSPRDLYDAKVHPMRFKMHLHPSGTWRENILDCPTHDPSTYSLKRVIRTTLTSGLAPSFQEVQSTSVFNGGLNGGVSTSLPASLSTAIPAGIPTLNLGQNFQNFGQLRPFEATRSQPLSYSTGMQLQLGGFGGIDYALRSSNPAPWPLELGVAKVGLSLPELPRHQLPTIHQG
ncbi:uncharacterized protein LOC143149700 [Ptiloglossa arizonensis]|uniref:uncharacterized protein LOC143149700 n=1 Tax=Ptiloglossa arizonensis TaxID=3350558 RepID=UPI003F9F4855